MSILLTGIVKQSVSLYSKYNWLKIMFSGKFCYLWCRNFVFYCQSFYNVFANINIEHTTSLIIKLTKDRITYLKPAN